MATSDFQAPGMTLVEIEDLVAQLLVTGNTGGYSALSTAQKTKVDHAITTAGLIAAHWEGREFSWMRGKGSFTTFEEDITKVARSASDVTTITVADVSNIEPGCRVRVSGVTLDDFDDDDALVTAVDTTGKTFTYDNAGATVSEVADATGTAAGHAYAIRTVNSSALTALTVPEDVFVEDDWALDKIDRAVYDHWIELYASTGQPLQYCLWNEITSTYSGGLMLGLIPIPDGEYVMQIPFQRQHSKITSAGSTDTALIVPPEYHHEIYVEGAIWLLRNDTSNPAGLAQCPRFVEAMQRMIASDPGPPDDGAGRYPPNRRVTFQDGGIYLTPTGLTP